MNAPADQFIQTLEQHLASKPGSPLSVRLAAAYLEQDRVQEALNLCDAAIAAYPLYTTAHLVRGRALQAMGMHAEARREFGLVQEILPGNAHVTELLSGLSAGGEETLVSPAAAPSEAAPPPVMEEEKVVAPPAAEVAAPLAEAAPPKTDVEQWLAAQYTEESQPLGTAVTLPPVEGEVIQQEKVGAVEEEDPLAALRGAVPEEPTATITQEPQPLSDVSVEGPKEESPTLAELLGQAPAGAETFGPAVETPAGETGSPFDQLAAPSEAGGTEETVGAESQDPFGIASGVEEKETVAEAPVGGAPSDEVDPFGMLARAGAEAGPEAGEEVAAVEEESFADFSDRMRTELSGTENTITLEEYLGIAAAPPRPPSAADEIEDLARKLKDAGRITPVINLAERTAATTEEETPLASGFVTPTLAEIYAKQGWYDDAIKAYRTLAVNKPAERERFEQRIQELEEQKRQQQGG